MNGAGAVAVAVDLGGTATKSGLVDPRGRILVRRDRPTRRDAPPAGMLSDIAGEAEALLAEARARGLRARGIGLGTPGLADPEGRIVGGCPNIPQWKGTAAGPRLARRLGMRVSVGNDANLAALGEWAFGAAKGARSCVLLTLGTGVGGGLVLDGKLFTGGTGLGTEIGHMTIDRNGRRCPCGGKGCLELYSSATGILKAYNSKCEMRNAECADVREVFSRARKGDRRARRVVGEALETLGLAMAGLINVFNPEFLILGGGMSRIPGVVPAARRAALRNAVDACRKGVRIVPARLGNDAGLVGAARLVLGPAC